jgi:hypothetical protein
MKFKLYLFQLILADAKVREWKYEQIPTLTEIIP